MSSALHQSPSNNSGTGAGTIMVFATAGHVDHGKSTLVKQLTGTNTDTLAEEKQRGLSINLGFAYHHFSRDEQPQHTLGFVDVPGHIDFINNMLAGVGSVDSSLLVIAADDGIMPQTIEHLAILHLLAIDLSAVVITKIDRSDAATLSKLEEEIKELLSAYDLREIPSFRVNSVTGDGIDALRNFLENLALSVIAENPLATQQNFRYLVDRSFSVTGIGTVVTGSARSGRAGLGDTFYHSGSGENCRIKGMRLDQAEISQLDAGSRAALNINLPWQSVKRGDWLLTRETASPCLRFDARLQLLNPGVEIKSSGQYHLYCGASHFVVNLRWLDKDKQLAQIKLNSAIHIHHGDRFIIRDPAATTTLGGGRVIDIFVPRRGRSTPDRLNFLENADNPALDALQQMLPSLEFGLNLDQFLCCRNLSSSYFEEICQRLKQKGQQFIELTVKFSTKPWLMSEDFFRQHCEKIISQLAQFHSNFSHEKGISESRLNQEINFEGSHLVLNAILAKLLESRRVMLSGTYLHLPDHRAQLSEEEKQFLSTVRPLLEKAGKLPPRTRELVEQTGIALGPLDKILKQASQRGHLVQIAINRYFLPETVMELAALAERLASSASEQEGFTVISFRDASGLGRNLCIEILEYFDRIGFTRRDGNQRFLRTARENIFAGGKDGPE